MTVKIFQQWNKRCKNAWITEIVKGLHLAINTGEDKNPKVITMAMDISLEMGLKGKVKGNSFSHSKKEPHY